MKKIDWYKTGEGFSISGSYFSPITMVAHIERLRGVKVIAKKSYFITDDFEAYLEYKGCRFIVETPFAEIEVSVIDKDAPKEVVREVLEHASNYKLVNPFMFIVAMVRYFFLPFNPH
ncbi:hypothetical protein ACJJI4_01420 [Microbulbifer sp. TRSA002]|uniref:hypothetical protein n=1 Tax=Microbulbifer sp. TRSA002 TaxID=3243382 RepID=UPI00403A4DE5